MKKILSVLVLVITGSLLFPGVSHAAAGIFASGGGGKTVGQTFTVTVSASGAEFDSFQGSISVSGPVDILAFSPGGATWLPGKAPSNGGQFVGITSPTSSLAVATIKLKAKAVGNGSVSVSNTKLARSGVVTGTDSGGTTFSIAKAPEPPSGPNVTSSSHPDQNSAYEATTILLSWDKAKGVDGFSYLLDQAEKTTPPAKSTSSETSASYADQAVGTYYFHVRAHNNDGWGSTTHFKVTIKEPEAKVDPSLPAPSNIKIEKSVDFINNVNEGTISGIAISGQTEPGFTANLTITPTPTLPEGKNLSALADETGKWEVLLDYPVISGFHKLTVQGQKEKILTPISEEIKFEISQVKGGAVNILTSDDEFAPVKAVKTPEKTSSFQLNKKSAIYGAAALISLVGIILITLLIRKKIKLKKLYKTMKK